MCSDVMCLLRSERMQASQLPLCKHGTPEITYGHAVHASQTIVKKSYCLTF